jgi:pyridoxal 5'-phosphate synthase pdxS subunit
MLKGGVIMDVTTPEQAKIAEEAGAAAVMALERIPADIRVQGGVARMSDPSMIRRIQETGDHPGHGEVPDRPLHRGAHPRGARHRLHRRERSSDSRRREHHIEKHGFRVPFVCGCRDLGEALRRIGEGAAMIRTKGEAGTGNVVEAVRHMRSVQRAMKTIQALPEEEWMAEAKKLGAPYELVRQVGRRASCRCRTSRRAGVATPRMRRS